MALFDKDKLNGILNSTKDVLKNTKEQVSKAVSDSSEQMKKYNEESKKLKEAMEGAIIRYGVTYKGGLAEYPKIKTGEEIGLNIMEDCFYLKPTITSVKWFSEMAIPYEKIKKLEIVERKISNAEWLLSSSESDMKSMEQKNTIEISYTDSNDNAQLIRLEMLTGVSIYGQARKCVEFMDVLRQNGILDKFSSGENKADSGNKETDILGQIEKLAQLREKGILNQEEFEQKKASLLEKL